MTWPEAFVVAVVLVFCTPLGWIGLFCLAIVISAFRR